mmetsp:Transcript_11520/g.33471  ORF Transcript_11520/g.33471 Transcript_11520/m.33471 type:complete len:207 (-) Transcript_11520:44-664(-)
MPTHRHCPSWAALLPRPFPLSTKDSSISTDAHLVVTGASRTHLPPPPQVVVRGASTMRPPSAPTGSGAPSIPTAGWVRASCHSNACTSRQTGCVRAPMCWCWLMSGVGCPHPSPLCTSRPTARTSLSPSGQRTTHCRGRAASSSYASRPDGASSSRGPCWWCVWVRCCVCCWLCGWWWVIGRGRRSCIGRLPRSCGSWESSHLMNE